MGMVHRFLDRLWNLILDIFHKLFSVTALQPWPKSIQKGRHSKEDMLRSSNIGKKPIGQVINLQDILIDPKHDVKAFDLKTAFGTIKVRDSVSEKRSVAFWLVGVNRYDLGQKKNRLANICKMTKQQAPTAALTKCSLR